jgi:hypothetical protein
MRFTSFVQARKMPIATLTDRSAASGSLGWWLDATWMLESLKTELIAKS